MNRKQKLIVSITGITIVMLSLLGLTYGYYLTRIQGNTNTNSISITTADLKLTYRDGMGELTAQNVMPGNEISSKTFTVENEGEQDVSAYTVALINIMNDFAFKDDLEVSVSCSSNINSGVCEGFAEDYEDNIYKEKYPATNSELFSLGIKEGEIHTYTLKVKYLYQDFDQSDDMGKTLKGKVQIYDPKDTIEVSGEVTGYAEGDYAEIHSDIQTSEIVDGQYKFVGIPADNHTVYIKNRNTNVEKSTTLEIKKGTTESTTNGVITFTDTSKIANVTIDTTNTNLKTTVNDVSNGDVLLKEVIIANAKRNISGRTIYKEVPISTPEVSISDANEMTLSISQDNYGISYYYRGNVIDNYVNFAGMCWRIVRIAGDDTIKIILDDANFECNSDSYTGNYSLGEVGYGSYFYCCGNAKDYLAGGLSTTYKDFQQTLENKLNSILSTNTLDNKLKSGDWCYDETAYSDILGENIIEDIEEHMEWMNPMYYGSYTRILGKKSPSLKCPDNMTLNTFSDGEPMFVGSITPDELVFAGAKSLESNLNYYLINEYQKLNSDYWWLYTPASFNGNDYIFFVQADGTLTAQVLMVTATARPAINLLAGTKVLSTGSGTKSNPYVIK